MSIRLKTYSVSVIMVIVVILVIASTGYAFKQREASTDLERLEFRADNLYISQTNVSLSEVMYQLPNRGVWQEFIAKNTGSTVFIDPRSGRPSTLVTVNPIIPGTGDGNAITLEDLSMKLGYK